MPTTVRSVLFLFVVVLGGCSLIKVDFEPCETAQDCATAFGPGHVCVERMFCEQLEPETRCEVAYPADLLTNPGAHRDRLIFGAIFNLSTASHIKRMEAIQLAIQEADDAGGIAPGVDGRGRPVGLLGCTSEFGDTDLQSAELARYLENDINVEAIIGPPGSGSVELAFNQTSDVLIISPSATSPKLVELEPQPTDAAAGRLWRTTAADSLQGVLIVDDIVTRHGPDAVAIIHQEGAYGDGIASVVRSEFQSRFPEDSAIITFGFQIRDQIDSSVVSLGRTPQIREVIFASSSIDDTIRFMELVAANDEFDDRNIFFTDSAANGDLLSAGMELGIRDIFFDNLRGTRPAEFRTPLYTSFITRLGLGGLSPENATFATHSYDAAWLAMYAASYRIFHDTGEEDACGAGCGMRRFRNLAGARETCINSSQNILEALRDPNVQIDVQGASGALSYRTGRGGVDEEELDADFELWTVNTERTGFVPVVETATPDSCTGEVDAR